MHLNYLNQALTWGQAFHADIDAALVVMEIWSCNAGLSRQECAADVSAARLKLTINS